MKSKKPVKIRKLLKPRRKPKKKVPKPKRAKTRKTRGTASSVAKRVTKARKRPVVKRLMKLRNMNHTEMRRLRLGRADGFFSDLGKHYDDIKESVGRHYDRAKAAVGESYDEAKERLQKFYNENEDTIDMAAKIALGALGVGALGFGAHRLIQDPAVMAQLAKVKDVISGLPTKQAAAYIQSVFGGGGNRGNSEAPGYVTIPPPLPTTRTAPSVPRSRFAAAEISPNYQVNLPQPATTFQQLQQQRAEAEMQRVTDEMAWREMRRQQQQQQQPASVGGAEEVIPVLQVGPSPRIPRFAYGDQEYGHQPAAPIVSNDLMAQFVQQKNQENAIAQRQAALAKRMAKAAAAAAINAESQQTELSRLQKAYSQKDYERWAPGFERRVVEEVLGKQRPRMPVTDAAQQYPFGIEGPAPARFNYPDSGYMQNPTYGAEPVEEQYWRSKNMSSMLQNPQEHRNILRGGLEAVERSRRDYERMKAQSGL